MIRIWSKDLNVERRLASLFSVTMLLNSSELTLASFLFCERWIPYTCRVSVSPGT